jgi:hypothetical protein
MRFVRSLHCVSSRFPSDPLITEPNFTVSHAERQVHSSIPCTHALVSLSLTLSLLMAANSALVRLALCLMPPPPRHMLLWCQTRRKRCHALTCKRMPSSYQHYRHNIVTETLRNAASRAGLPSTHEPLYRELDSSGHSSGNTRGDVFVIINPGPGSTAVDTFVPHPFGATSLAHDSAETPGTAAAAASKSKHHAFASHRVPGLKFC